MERKTADRFDSTRRPENEIPNRSVLPLIICFVAIVAVGALGGFLLWGRLGAEKQEQSATVQQEQNPEEKAAAEELERAQQIVEGLSLEQKVAQLFVVRPEGITGVDVVTEAGKATREAISEAPIGGLVYSQKNLVDAKQVSTMLKSTQNYVKDSSGLPAFLCVEEEGGPHGPITAAFLDKGNVGSAARIGASNDVEEARDGARQIGTYMADYGFNFTFAPVADVVSTVDSDLSDRSYGDDPAKVASMTEAAIDGFLRANVICAVKHFPGTGDAEKDPHNSRLYLHKSAEELKQRELVPFKAAIDAGVPVVVVSNMSCLGIGNGEGDLPSWMSKTMVGEILRNDLGFKGVAATDMLDDASVDDACDPSDQGVRAVQAGIDLIVCPKDFDKAYRGLIKAVENGEIPESRIDESVLRIVRLKQSLSS